MRGTRQERYCWMCKGMTFDTSKYVYVLTDAIEFWNARLLAAGLSASEAQIPLRPDQVS